jgi:hypothetical protein
MPPATEARYVVTRVAATPRKRGARRLATMKLAMTRRCPDRVGHLRIG